MHSTANPIISSDPVSVLPRWVPGWPAWRVSRPEPFSDLRDDRKLRKKEKGKQPQS